MQPSDTESAGFFFAWPIFALVLWGAAPVPAQKTPAIFLDEIVVTATRRPDVKETADSVCRAVE